MSRRTRVIGIASACLVGALAVGTATWSLATAADGAGTRASAAQSDGDRHGTTTVPVEQGDLVETRTIAGALGYGTPTSVPGAASGTLTWLPQPGQVVHRDEPLYAVDERPVRALYGTTPLWRSLRAGARGADVRQLTENLAALGYEVPADDVFGARTGAAVRQWQRDRGLPVTGVVDGDQIAFVDGAVRVASVVAQLGQPVGGDVLQVTSTHRVVSVRVPARDAGQLGVGRRVRVLVNGAGGAMPGSVTDATPAETEDGRDEVDVTVAFDAGDRRLPAAASAQVVAEGRTERDVLSVPVSALVARGSSGYAVEVVDRDGSAERVPVEVGLVADGRAAVTGDLDEGARVVVPS